VLYFGIKFYESQRKQEEAMLKAVALAQEAQLKMLRYQLKPAFPVQHPESPSPRSSSTTRTARRTTP